MLVLNKSSQRCPKKVCIFSTSEHLNPFVDATSAVIGLMGYTYIYPQRDYCELICVFHCRSLGQHAGKIQNKGDQWIP